LLFDVLAAGTRHGLHAVKDEREDTGTLYYRVTARVTIAIASSVKTDQISGQEKVKGQTR